MQREISDKVFLGNTVSPYNDIGEDMTKTLLNTYLVLLSLNFRGCLKT